MTADAYATAFMVLDMKKARSLANQRKEIEVCLIYKDENGKIKQFYSNDFSKYLAPQEE